MTFRAPLLIAKNALTLVSALLDQNGLGFNSETKGAIPRPRQTTFFWGFICQTYERNDIPQPEFAGMNPSRIPAPLGVSSLNFAGRFGARHFSGMGGALGERSLIVAPSRYVRFVVRESSSCRSLFASASSRSNSSNDLKNPIVTALPSGLKFPRASR